MGTRFLAQLRLAGFPQPPDAVPTCAELIEGCGEALQSVEWDRSATEWTAYSRDGPIYAVGPLKTRWPTCGSPRIGNSTA